MQSAFDGFTPADLIEAIGTEKPLAAIFTSFTFSQAAFAEQYLKPLQHAGCNEITVLVDSLG